MIAVITGDIINSQAHHSKEWVGLLTNYLNTFGVSPKTWEIYRGDEFQLKLTSPATALITAIHLKSLLKSTAGMDVRIGIGLGEEDYNSAKVTQSNGSAYVYSGRVFEQSKIQKDNLLIKSNHPDFDTRLNLILQLALTFMDNWTQVSAKMVKYALENPQQSQQEVAAKLNVSQSTVSQRLSRAHFDLILKVEAYFKTELQKIRP